jgi:hypothetical protein
MAEMNDHKIASSCQPHAPQPLFDPRISLVVGHNKEDGPAPGQRKGLLQIFPAFQNIPRLHC